MFLSDGLGHVSYFLGSGILRIRHGGGQQEATIIVVFVCRLTSSVRPLFSVRFDICYGLYISVVICSDTSPIRKIKTEVMKSSALMLVNLPYSEYVYP